jgi:hypothetical protein
MSWGHYAVRHLTLLQKIPSFNPEFPRGDAFVARKGDASAALGATRRTACQPLIAATFSTTAGAGKYDSTDSE